MRRVTSSRKGFFIKGLGGVGVSFLGVVLFGVLASSVRGEGTQEVPAGGASSPDGGIADGGMPSVEANGGVAPAVPLPSFLDAGISATVAPPSFLDTTDRRIRDERPAPSPEQLASLREMEAEVDRFTRSGSAYKNSVVSLLRREYMRQRRVRDQWYSRQIGEEERILNEARDKAILMFERFVARYPDDPTYTPDAMFRLGELYFERSQMQFQQRFETGAQEGAETAEGEAPAAPVLDTPDYSPTVDLYQRLVRQFPNYRRIDGVYYLIGFCLNEMGRIEEARLAWLNLVCANRFKYDPDATVNPETGAVTTEEPDPAVAAHPAMTLEASTSSGADTPFHDIYQGCEPVRDGAEFVSETWFRIGEYHFDDYRDPHALDLAISAYSKILAVPDDRNYNLALYKVAWSYYRASRYPEAIKYFGMLVQWSDDEQARTGKAGSELRPEALSYLAISFAYDDWNENRVPDPEEGGPTGILRIQDSHLVPQDKAWTPEVYYQLGQVYFDEAKYPEAIAVWRLMLDRWPMHPKAPEVTNLIARAYTRHDEMQAAIQWRGKLSDFSEGSEWWNRNVEHPSEQRQAEQLAENALINTAVFHHQEAQSLRRRCVADREPELCTQAQAQYALASTAYREYLQRYPNNPQAYELQYNLADALYWSEAYEDAAKEYASVRDSNLDDRHLSEAARRVVESLKRLTEIAEEKHELEIRETPPDPQGDPPAVTPIVMPDLLQRLAQAREMYNARVPERDDREHVRAAYDYNNALLLYAYGYWPQARERFERIFQERCTGPMADESGRVAWINLRNIAAKLNNVDEVERLGRTLTERRCTFASEGEAAAPADCSKPENQDQPQCIAAKDITNIRYKRALDIFKQAERATGDEQRRLYEQAAQTLVQAVNQEPGHEEAPVALEQAAIALERTSRFESAAALYQRIIDEVGPRQGRNPEEQQKLDSILANAYFRLAFNANRFFDFERAVENYRVLADSRRFGASSVPAIVEKREDALINAAIIFERLQNYPKAAEYYRRAVEVVHDPEVKRRAAYQLAETSFKRRDWGGTVRAMQDFIAKYERDPQASEFVVQAYWRIAQARKSLNQQREYNLALQNVVNGFGRSGQQPGSIAAEYAAQAKFSLVDEAALPFENFAIQRSAPATMEAYVQDVARQIEGGTRQAKTFAEGYNPVVSYRRPNWTIAAFVRQGRIYEVLAKAVLNTPFTMPRDLQKQLKNLGTDQREEIRIQVEDRIRQTLDEKVRPIECLAVARYALAARAARAGSIDNEHTRIAIDRLQAYGDERIAECIAQAASQDASFEAYRPGEFTRAPRGQDLDIESGVAAPSLVGEGQ